MTDKTEAKEVSSSQLVGSPDQAINNDEAVEPSTKLNWRVKLQKGGKVDYFCENSVWLPFEIITIEHSLKDKTSSSEPVSNVTSYITKLHLKSELSEKVLKVDQDDVNLAMYQSKTKINKTEKELEDENREMFNQLSNTTPLYTFTKETEIAKFAPFCNYEPFLKSLTSLDCDDTKGDDFLKLQKDNKETIKDAVSTFLLKNDILQLMSTSHQENYQNYRRTMKITDGKLSHKFVNFYSDLKIRVSNTNDISVYLYLEEGECVYQACYNPTGEFFFFPFPYIPRKDYVIRAMKDDKYIDNKDWYIECRGNTCSLKTAYSLFYLLGECFCFNIESEKRFIFVGERIWSYSYEELGYKE